MGVLCGAGQSTCPEMHQLGVQLFRGQLSVVAVLHRFILLGNVTEEDGATQTSFSRGTCCRVTVHRTHGAFCDCCSARRSLGHTWCKRLGGARLRECEKVSPLVTGGHPNARSVPFP